MPNYKPQSPLVMNGEGIFPLTTYDQIIMPDGSRWNGEASAVTLNGYETNAATLYAPGYSGEAGQVLLSSGDKQAPYWTSPNALWTRGMADETWANTAYVGRATTAAISLTQDSKLCWTIERTARNDNSLTAHFYDENGGWAAQGKLLSELNYTDFTVGKDGTGATGTWNITTNFAKHLKTDSAAAHFTSTKNVTALLIGICDNKHSWATERDGTNYQMLERYYNTDGTYYDSYIGLNSNNYSDYALPLAGGTLTGALTTKQLSISENSLYINKGNYPAIRFNMNDGSTRLGTIQINAASNGSYATSLSLGVQKNASTEYTATLSASDGTWNATKVTGAVWNDYAEYRTAETIEPGRVVREDKDGVMKITTERLMPACEITSDTFGFAIGETDACKTPIAVAGRVLVYTDKDRYSFQLGDAVCSGPNGTVSRMIREEIREYPERIIGTVSEIPEYETWGTGNVEVNGRIWIKVR